MEDEFAPLDIEIMKSMVVMAVASQVEMTDERGDALYAHVDAWFAEEIRKAKNDAWHEGFSAGWDECDDPDAFVNDKWDAKTPNPYRQGEDNG